MSDEPGTREPAPPAARNTRRNAAGIGFVLLGGYFAWGSFSLDTSAWLHVLLAAVGIGVLGYGVVQLLQARR